MAHIPTCVFFETARGARRTNLKKKPKRNLQKRYLRWASDGIRAATFLAAFVPGRTAKFCPRRHAPIYRVRFACRLTYYIYGPPRNTSKCSTHIGRGSVRKGTLRQRLKQRAAGVTPLQRPLLFHTQDVLPGTAKSPDRRARCANRSINGGGEIVHTRIRKFAQVYFAKGLHSKCAKKC